jgi:hypothetical protein
MPIALQAGQWKQMHETALLYDWDKNMAFPRQ